MPKNRNLSGSDSDSGPEDRNPPKKQKTSSGNSSGGGNPPKTNDDGDSYWDLGSKKRVSVRTFKGSVYVDIREFYEKDGKMLPGKKGIALKAGDWNSIKNLMEDIDEAVRTK